MWRFSTSLGSLASDAGASVASGWVVVCCWRPENRTDTRAAGGEAADSVSERAGSAFVGDKTDDVGGGPSEKNRLFAMGRRGTAALDGEVMDAPVRGCGETVEELVAVCCA